MIACLIADDVNCFLEQGPAHPHPGQRFTVRGFPRVGYLPDNDEGRLVSLSKKNSVAEFKLLSR